MLVAPSPKAGLFADLRDELAIQSAGSLGEIDVSDKPVQGLIEQLAAQRDNVVLIYGFDEWTDHLFSSLDINRSGLETGSFLVLCVNLKTAGRFLDSAPNIRSYLGANIFVAAPDPSQMGPGEIAERLVQLREFYNLSDAEVIARAERRELPSEPQFIEWLVLLGRSELAS